MFTMTGHGRLAAEPHLQQVANNQSLVNFRLISNRWTRNGDVPEVVTFFAFGEMAERFASAAVKGQIVYATGVQETHKGRSRDGGEREYVQYRLLHFTLGPKPRAPNQSDAEAHRAGESRPRAPASSDGQSNQNRPPQQPRSAPAQLAAGGADGGSMDDRPFFGDDDEKLL